MQLTSGEIAKNAYKQQRMMSRLGDGRDADPYDGLHRVAVQECARTGTKASYPSGYLELNSHLNDSASARDFRRILPFDADKARREMAKGISLGNLTDPEMGSVIEYDSRFKTDTPYWRAIQAQAAA